MSRTKKDKDWVWSSDEASGSHCHNCDMLLYGVKEINDGLCCWCKDEEMALLEEEMLNASCECCDIRPGTYNDNFNAVVCETCKDSLGA